MLDAIQVAVAVAFAAVIVCLLAGQYLRGDLESHERD
jgi:hypothetical protein